MASIQEEVNKKIQKVAGTKFNTVTHKGCDFFEEEALVVLADIIQDLQIIIELQVQRIEELNKLVCATTVPVRVGSPNVFQANNMVVVSES